MLSRKALAKLPELFTGGSKSISETVYALKEKLTTRNSSSGQPDLTSRTTEDTPSC